MEHTKIKVKEGLSNIKFLSTIETTVIPLVSCND